MSGIPFLQLTRQYPAFLKEAQRELRLGPEQLGIAQRVRPDTFAYWSAATLSGGEAVSAMDDTDAERWGAPLFVAPMEYHGRTVLDFRGGQLSEHVQTMYQSSNPTLRDRFERFSATVAHWTFTVGNAIGLTSEEWRRYMPSTPQTVIAPDSEGGYSIKFLGLPGFRYPIEVPVRSFMTLGPGLTGAELVGNTIGESKHAYLISGGISAHYVTGYTDFSLQAMAAGIEGFRRAGTLRHRLPPQVDAQRARLPEVHYGRDGIARGMGMLATKQTVDVVLMSAVHSAGTEECLAGIAGAKQHLRQGGLLVIKAPDKSLGTEAGMDRIADSATEQFGEPVAHGPCGELQQSIDPSLPVQRLASFAIYQQQ